MTLLLDPVQTSRWQQALDAAPPVRAGVIRRVLSGGFEIASDDGPFVLAKAQIDGNTVIVSSDSVPNPVDLALDGNVQSFNIPVTNTGIDEDLIVSAAVFTGDPNFSVTTLPGPIVPGATGDILRALCRPDLEDGGVGTTPFRSRIAFHPLIGGDAVVGS